MGNDRQFTVKRNYSFISGLQEYAQEEYEVSGKDSELTIIFRSQESEKSVCEEGKVFGISFDSMRRFVTYLSENAYRQGVWKDAVSDFCFGNHGAFITDKFPLQSFNK